MTAGGSRDLRDGLVNAAGAVALWLVVSVSFARSQELWMDETTQLSGISLGPIEVLPWLSGHGAERFGGIPADRMPPLSYDLGWFWSKLFGMSENSLRGLGITALSLALLLVVLAARRAFGPRAGWLAGLGFALCPNIVVYGPEIRAYPLLLLWSAAAFWFLLRVVEPPPTSTRTWVGLGVSCLLAIYTHFFGLVLTGAVLCAALAVLLAERRPLKPWFFTAVPLGASAAGLLPFILASSGMSPGKTELPSFSRSVVRLVYHTLGGHPSLSIYAPLVLMSVGGAAAGFVVANLGGGRRITAARALSIAVVAGLGAVIAARLATKAFDSLTPSYSLWMVPAMALLLSSVVSAESARLRQVGFAFVALSVLGSAGATLVMLSNATTFGHCAGDRINQRLRESGAVSELVVVHEPEGQWHHSYCPLRYEFGAALRQYRAVATPSGGLELRLLPEERVVIAPEALRARRVVVMDFEFQGADAVKDYVRSERAPALSDGKVQRALAAEGYRITKEETLMAIGAQHVSWLQRSATAP